MIFFLLSYNQRGHGSSALSFCLEQLIQYVQLMFLETM